MHSLRVMSSRGDDAVVWSDDLAEAQTAAVREAESIFQSAMLRRDSAFVIVEGEKPRRVTTFDRTAPLILILPRVVGG